MRSSPRRDELSNPTVAVSKDALYRASKKLNSNNPLRMTPATVFCFLHRIFQRPISIRLSGNEKMHAVAVLGVGRGTRRRHVQPRRICMPPPEGDGMPLLLSITFRKSLIRFDACRLWGDVPYTPISYTRLLDRTCPTGEYHGCVN